MKILNVVGARPNLMKIGIEPTPPGDGGGGLLDEHTALTRRPSLPLLTVLGSGLVGILWLGVYPKPLIDAIEAASRAVMP